MNPLSELKPAETLLLKNGTNADFKNLMKYTFMDLLLKNVLVIKDTTLTYRSSRGERYVAAKYVIIGAEFNVYHASPFEEIFLAPFRKAPTLKAIFKKLIKVAYDQVRTEASFRKIIVQNSPLSPLVKKFVFFHVLGNVVWNAEGKIFRNKVISQLQEIDGKINRLLKENPTEATRILAEIGGNICLLKNMDFALLHEVDKEFQVFVQVTEHTGTGNGCSSCSGSFFYSWDDTSNSFDSGYDAAGCSSDSSGCSSCSGCSGCGGCGGCS